ncbi:hypothetical protein QJS10_CPA07g00122 [Acorus calamus]|uniref:Peptidase M48 domain-containing protein n=1 Tax=Acorus calamus TaxID=4465 RepID=A0AAV9EEA1_ACOCL|nr:hypothetical protein QJS10_CPA07g00122 [Acorus calamus]
MKQSLRNEIEAEYIGMLLMASAGYDPRAMITMRKKIVKKAEERPCSEHLSTHPYVHSFQRFMTQTHIMGEALTIYNETPSQKERNSEDLIWLESLVLPK